VDVCVEKKVKTKTKCESMIFPRAMKKVTIFMDYRANFFERYDCMFLVFS
jgi:hypothetical protein